jgi:hypothetical protein
MNEPNDYSTIEQEVFNAAGYKRVYRKKRQYAKKYNSFLLRLAEVRFGYIERLNRQRLINILSVLNKRYLKK